MHRFVLQPYKSPASRFRCPQCLHNRRTFTRYIDLETDSHLADHVGKCDREYQCGYHYTPRQYFAENPGDERLRHEKVRDTTPAKDQFNQLPANLVTESTLQSAYFDNNFIQFLAPIFGWKTLMKAAQQYRIGTAKHWHGATVFWQIDTKGRVRTGKIMLYDEATCKRVKKPFNHIAWVHTLLSPKSKVLSLESQLTSDLRLSTQDFLLRQCFFGEHLLPLHPTKPVGITESEKTAVMASILMPQFVWLAAGALNGLDERKCRVLKNREVVLFPDVGAYHHWTECARSLNLKIPTATFTVHQEMERTATPEERATGADMADRWIEEWLEEMGSIK